ncbi:hypothetical protein NKG94_21845 [Micromonospora sp. M12]
MVELPLLRLPGRGERRGDPSQSFDAYATKTAGVAKVLVGGGRTTGNLTVNLQRLDTTSGIVQNNQVRVLTQRIPHNGGGAVAGRSRSRTAWSACPTTTPP